MSRRPWLRAYLALFVVAMTLCAIGIAQSCPRTEGGYLIQGCGHDLAASAALGHGINWLVISGVVAILGTAIVLLRGRRPTVSSLLIWISAGFVELAIPASLYITPNVLTIPLIFSSAAAVLVAIPAGGSTARDAREPKPSAKTRFG